jgi:hypothetical protein
VPVRLASNGEKLAIAGTEVSSDRSRAIRGNDHRSTWSGSVADRRVEQSRTS